MVGLASISRSSRLAISAGCMGLRKSRANDPSITRSTSSSKRCSACTDHLLFHQSQLKRGTMPHPDYTVALGMVANVWKAPPLRRALVPLFPLHSTYFHIRSRYISIRLDYNWVTNPASMRSLRNERPQNTLQITDTGKPLSQSVSPAPAALGVGRPDAARDRSVAREGLRYAFV